MQQRIESQFTNLLIYQLLSRVSSERKGNPYDQTH